MGKLGPCTQGASLEWQQRNTDSETGLFRLNQVPDVLQGQGSAPTPCHQGGFGSSHPQGWTRPSLAPPRTTL